MSVWRDILSPLPEDAQTVFFRRHPQATPTAWGVWHNEIAGIRAGPNDWEIGHNDIAAWRPFTGSVPAYPAPSPPDNRWRDIFWNPPAHGQSGWVRRWDQDCVVIRCMWDTRSHSSNVRWVCCWREANSIRRRTKWGQHRRSALLRLLPSQPMVCAAS